MKSIDQTTPPASLSRSALVIGSGAIGSFYGSLLARAGFHVSILARSDYDEVLKNGIRIRSETRLGEWHFKPQEVVKQASELTRKPDYVLLCTKVVPDTDRVGLLRKAVGPETTIVLISNGVEIEEEIAAAFPDNELISGLAFICVTRTEPGQIWHQAYGRLALGNYPSGLSPQVMELCEAFTRAGIGCEGSERIVTSRWQKCLWNAAFNPLSVLAGGLGTREILTHQEPLIRAIMEEVSQIATAVGHPLPEGIIDQQIVSTHKMPPYKTSMLLDFEAGRPMESEAILGNAVRAGKRTAVAIPHLETIHALLKLVELRHSLPGED